MAGVGALPWLLGADGVLFSGSELLHISAKPSGMSCGAPLASP